MQNLKLNKKQKGLTLVELMVAMVLSIVLVGGVSQTYLSTKQTYRLTEAQSRIQENGRFALYTLTKDIRMADFWGCLTGVPPTNRLNYIAGGAYDYSDGVDGTNDDGLNGSDSITLGGAFDNGINVTVDPGGASVKVSDNSGLEENDIVLVSDCLVGDIFQITNDPATGSAAGKDELVHNTGVVSAGPGNASDNLNRDPEPYGTDAKVYEVGNRTYFIKAGASGEPGLHVTDNTLEATLIASGASPSLATLELVEGVENMQILYGVDTDGDYTPNYYVHAGTVPDMEQVVSVKVSLLLHSMENNVTSNNLTVNYNGGTSTIANRRLGRVFSATITIRNRMQ